MKTLIFLSLVFFSISSCSKNEANDSIPQLSSLFGKWKLIEIKYNDGGSSPNWSTVQNGFIITLNTSSTYITTEYSECNTGSFNFQNSIITYTNSCGNLTIPNKYKVISVTKDELIISNVNCIEECTQKLKKIE